MVGISHQRFQRVWTCRGCGRRTMCVSQDGGTSFYCNRCAVAYGTSRAKFYDDPKLAALPKANYDLNGNPIIDQVQTTNIIEEKKEVKKEPTAQTETQPEQSTEETA